MKQVFACIDVDHPVVAWGAYRGVLVSANAVYKPPNCPVSMMLAGILHYGNTSRLLNELIIEKHRQQFFPGKNSRLTSMYFFQDEAAIDELDDWGGHFSKDYMAEIALYPVGKIYRHDSNWITYATKKTSGIINDQSWIKAYWSGDKFPDKKPIWEMIAHGRAVIYGTKLRERAYKNIIGHYPDAVAILEASRIAAHSGSDLGQVKAWFDRESASTVMLKYYLDMRDAHKPEVLKQIGEYAGHRNYKDLAVGGDMFALPDFGNYSVRYCLSEPFDQEFYSGIHENII